MGERFAETIGNGLQNARSNHRVTEVGVYTRIGPCEVPLARVAFGRIVDG